MAKSADAFRTISEVAEWLDTPAHVLRFWESRFSQVKPVKRAGGRRYYRPNDMLLLGGIKKLLHEDGMTIKGAQKLLRTDGIKKISALSQSLDPEDKAALDLAPDDTVVEGEFTPSPDDIVLDAVGTTPASVDALETDPQVEIAPEVIIEPAQAESVTISEPVVEATVEAVAEPEAEASLETPPELVVEPVPVATDEPVVETEPDVTPEPETEPGTAADLVPEPEALPEPEPLPEPMDEAVSPALPDVEAPKIEIVEAPPTLDEPQPALQSETSGTAQTDETKAQLTSIYDRLTVLHERMKTNIDPKRQG